MRNKNYQVGILLRICVVESWNFNQSVFDNTKQLYVSKRNQSSLKIIKIIGMIVIIYEIYEIITL